MSEKMIETARHKQAEAEKRLAEIRRTIMDQEAIAAAAQKEIEQWSIFVQKWEELNKESLPPHTAENAGNGDSKKNQSDGNTKIKLRKNTTPAHLAAILAVSPNREMRAVDMAMELKAKGLIESGNFRNMVYTTLVRRSDVFERTSPGRFKLIADYEIEE